jgi:diguanylate cyclase (GGDEF)-like protein/PAS domain S-box-containing protein
MVTECAKTEFGKRAVAAVNRAPREPQYKAQDKLYLPQLVGQRKCVETWPHAQSGESVKTKITFQGHVPLHIAPKIARGARPTFRGPQVVIFKKELLDQPEEEKILAEAAQTVMIIDDEDANRTVMACILKPHFNVLEARDGPHALSTIEDLPDPNNSLSCIISDHRMPHLTGVELFERLKPRLPNPVRIIVTGFIDVDAIIDSINNAGIYKFIIKPFDPVDFLMTITRAVESFQLHQKLSCYYADLENQVRIRTCQLEKEIVERKRAEAELNKAAQRILSLYNNAACGYHSVDSRGVFMEINDTELQWLGRSREEMISSMSLFDIVSPTSMRSFLKKYPAIKENGWIIDLHDIEFELVCKDGSVLPVLAHSSVIDNDDSKGAVSRFTVFNITDRKQAEERFRHMATHDALTNLPNRNLLRDRVARDILLALRNKRRIAILFVDLDHFKKINDTLGHHVGDRLLQQVANRMGRCIRKSDSLARLGGDEFVISLADILNGRDAGIVAGKIIHSLERPFDIDGHTLQIGSSIGIGVYPEDGADADELMRCADTAMYAVKQSGRNQYRFFSPEFNDSSKSPDDRNIQDDDTRSA